MRKNRFEEMGKSKKAIILISIIFAIIFMIEFISLKLVGLPGQHEEYNFRILTGYYNQPNRPLARYEGDEPFLQKKYSVIPATDSYGFSLDSNDDPNRDLTRENKCEFRVFVFGGSSLEGRFLSNEDDTIPARIEIEIKKLIGSNGINATVVNGGSGSFFSAQEFNLMQSKVRYSMHPGHVIFLNGSNDFTIWPVKTSLENTNLHPYQVEMERKIRDQSDNVLLAQVDSFLEENVSSYFAAKKALNNPKRAVKRILSLFDKGTKYPQQVIEDESQNRRQLDRLLGKHIDRYLFNMVSAMKLAGPEFRVSVFFQPTLLQSTPKSEEEKLMFKNVNQTWHDSWDYDYLDAKAEYYKKVSKKISEFKRVNEYSNIYDISDLFINKSASETFFGDHVHYMPRGREVITMEVMRHLKPLIEAGLLQISETCHE